MLSQNLRRMLPLAALLAAPAFAAPEFASRAEMDRCYAARHADCGHVARGGRVSACLRTVLNAEVEADATCLHYYRTALRPDGSVRRMRLAREAVANLTPDQPPAPRELQVDSTLPTPPAVGGTEVPHAN